VNKLRFIAHTTHPSSLPHQFFVDGPVSAADVWLGSGAGTSKAPGDWHTLVVFGEGKGVRDRTNNFSPPAQPWRQNADCSGGTSATYNSSNRAYYCGSYLWSSQASCDYGFSGTYNAANYPHYCGYHALEFTNTSLTDPSYKWRINSVEATKQISSSHGPYLGEPWSKMAIGKVLINNEERWVGFMGGGYGQSGTGGKGFFVVDMSNGKILWAKTYENDSSMSYIPASPAIVDTDNDGFVDTAYVGDLSGNMWRFTFCTQAQGSSCGTVDWGAGKLLAPATAGPPIFTTAVVARDISSNLWVFWGTGDKINPNSATAGKFFAIKDYKNSSGNWPLAVSDLADVGSYTEAARGWSITPAATGEKILSDPDVFNGMILFATYVPYLGANACAGAGTSNLYARAMQKTGVGGTTYNTGATLLPSGQTSESLGTGIASAPVTVIQGGRNPQFFVSVSGGAKDQGGEVVVESSNIRTKGDFTADSAVRQLIDSVAPFIHPLYWRDGRIQ
jgi:Tfp pilus tip-associated adhesin PilY1